MYTRVMHFINIHASKSILLCSSVIEHSNLFKSLTDSFTLPAGHIINVSRKNYNEACGLQFLTDYSVKENRVQLLNDLKGKYYTLSSLGSLILHIQNSMGMLFVKNSVKFSIYSLNGIMMIDYETAKNMELVASLMGKNCRLHLFKKVNYTNSPMGHRLLRQQLLQPSTDLNTIKLRQECINALILDQVSMKNIATILKSLCDVEKLISSFVKISKNNSNAPDYKIVNILAVKNILNQALNLRDLCKKFENPLFQIFCENFGQSDADFLLENIASLVNENCMFTKNSNIMKDSKFYCVNYGINGLLDAARSVCNSCEVEINNYIQMLSQTYSIPFKAKYTKGQGYTIAFNTSEAIDRSLPEILINKRRNSRLILCTTMDLLKMNDRYQECLTEIFLLSDQLLDGLTKLFSEHAKYFYVLSESFALLDVLVSLANYASSLQYFCFPEFTDTIAIQEAHHPIFESYVANNYYCYEGANFEIISGPNMSGKSTYIKQLGYIVVLAQIGSCIPAKYASLKIFDKIMSRINNNDDIESSSSSFFVEMKEMSTILQNHSPGSLILIDELGRGTSIHDGFSITFAICEVLIREKFFVYFVTHFLQLCDELDIYPNVVNLHFESTIGENHEISQTFIIQKGPTTETGYGIEFAIAKKLPHQLIEYAYKVAQHIESLKSQRGAYSFNSIVVKERNLKMRFFSKIRHLIIQTQSSKDTLMAILEENFRKLQQDLQDLQN